MGLEILFSKVWRDIIYWIVVIATCVGLNALDTKKQAMVYRYPYHDSAAYQTLLACILSCIANLGAVAYHSRFPAHPKFHLLRKRRICLYVHIFSGLTEIFFMMTAFFSPIPSIFSYGAAAAAILGHVPSALYQWPIVFGIKKVMLPMYFLFIASHFMGAVMLIQSPNDPLTLAKLCIALHGYVWVRVGIAILQLLNIMREYEYTVAIFFAGFVMTPMFFGVGANFLFLASFVLFQLIVEPIMKLFGVQVAGFKNEASRGLVLLDNRKRMVAMRHLAEMPENLRSEFDSVEIYSDEDLARIVFRRLDTNGDGSLQADELKSLVVTLGHSPSKAEKLIAKWDTDGSGDISFTEFYNHIWNFNTAKDRLLATNAVTATQTKNLDDEEIARLVFDGLVGGDEVLEAAVLEELLCSWGLPPAEVREYFMEFDEDRNGLISFEEFQKHFGPFYRYAHLMLGSEVSTTYAVPRRKKSMISFDSKEN